MGVIGLSATGNTVVIPRQDDCIALFLGSRRAAQELNLSYQEIEGIPELLGKMCTGPGDDEFVVAPPGHIIRLEDFGMAPAREHQHSGLFREQKSVSEASGRYLNPSRPVCRICLFPVKDLFLKGERPT